MVSDLIIHKSVLMFVYRYQNWGLLCLVNIYKNSQVCALLKGNRKEDLHCWWQGRFILCSGKAM